MRILRLIVAGIFLMFFFVKGESQIDSTNFIIEKLIENYAESNEITDFDFNTAFEELNFYRRRKLDLNSATEEQLQNLFFLNPIQIRDIINHRFEYGDFYAIEELQSIPSMDVATINNLREFVSLNVSTETQLSLRSALSDGTSNLFLKYKRFLQDKRGYLGEEPNYAGTPDHYYARYRFDGGKNLKFGATVEKDPGEEFFTGSNRNGFDFYSAFLYMGNVTKRIKAINLGDYSISLGQGLILQNSFGTGKSAFVMDIKSGGQVVRPYSSVNETNFFRGGAITLDLSNNIELTAFGSRKMTDGSVIAADTMDIDAFNSVTSIIRSGLHRTQSEIARKGSVEQINYGGNIQFNNRSFHLGASFVAYDFSRALQPSDQPYNKFRFRGDALRNASIDYGYRYKNLNFFGEVARSSNGGIAQLHSLLIGLDRNIDMSFSFRDYGKDYQVLEANAFSEGSLPINERAFYVGAEIRVAKGWTWSSYFDIWKNDWLRFRVDAPGQGREIFSRIEYVKKRRFLAYAQYRYETKSQNLNNESLITEVGNLSTHRIRLQANNKISKEIELRNRVELSYAERGGTRGNGYLIFQDVIYKPTAKPYSFAARYALFDTDNFDTRIYAFENDILYEFAIPFFQDRGSRAYIKAKYRFNRLLTWEIRYDQTVLYQENNDGFIPREDLGFGSGNERVDGRIRSQIKTQLKFKF